VDDGLAGVTKLVSLANTLGSIPTNHITFTTMPAINDPYNPQAWLAPAPNAQQLFDAIANDQSLSGDSKPSGSASTPTAGATPSAATASVDPSTIEVHVINGTGITGRAAAVQTELANKGYSNAIVSRTPTANVSATKVEYATSDPKYKGQAQQVAKDLGLPSSALTTTTGITSIHLVVGPDLKVDGSGGSSSTSTKPPANIGQATANAHTENAGDSVKCAQATRWKLEGMPASAAAYQGLTVEQAYAKATREGIPDSDKQH
jgi:hypothetical protein